jgi:hypothetical protein
MLVLNFSFVFSIKWFISFLNVFIYLLERRKESDEFFFFLLLMMDDVIMMMMGKKEERRKKEEEKKKKKKKKRRRLFVCCLLLLYNNSIDLRSIKYRFFHRRIIIIRLSTILLFTENVLFFPPNK